MLTFLKLFGIFFAIGLCLTCCVEVLNFLRKKKINKLENGETEVGMHPITWEEMRQDRGVDATEFFMPVIRQVLWKHYVRQFTLSFLIMFILTFVFHVGLSSLDKLYELEEVCKPGMQSMKAGVHEGKTSKSIEGLRETDPLEVRLKTCRDWGFNP